MIELTTDPDHRILVGSSLAEHDLPDGIVADCLIADPPYSARTHEGHDSLQRHRLTVMYNDKTGLPVTTKVGRRINYSGWTEQTAQRACLLWSPRVAGWIVVITDHILAPFWAAGLEAQGRYVFAHLPWFSPGSRVRLAGDGPSSWTCWIVVARPRHEPYSKWGTLPGGYVTRPEHCDLAGGKPLTLMRALVRDYSRECDTVWDPCCGAGTTMVAARMEGRRSIGMEIDRETAELAARRVGETRQETIRFPARPAGEQGSLIP